MTLAVFLISLMGLILVSVPIFIVLVITTILMMMIENGGVSSVVLTQTLIKGVDSFPLLAIPFFMLAGEIMNKGGITKRIVRFCNALVGSLRGGIGYVTVLASMIFAGVSGSAVADTAAVGSVLLPIMRENEYDVPTSTALLCSAGCIGPIIPPSIPMIMYGVAVEVSVVRLFLGGIIPGVLIGIALMIIWYIHSKKNNYPSFGKFSLTEVFKATLSSIWAIATPVLIMVCIIGGVATPTEVAAVAVIYATVVSMFIYREVKIFDFKDIIIDAGIQTATIMIVVGGATCAAYMIMTARIPQLIADVISAMTDSPIIIMLLINILFLLVGCVMDMGCAILILAPVLAPLARTFNIDLVHFGVIMTVNLCIGLLTPPVGNVLYLGCSMAKISMAHLVKALLPFIAVMIVVLMLISYIPALVLFIPNLLMGA